MIEKNSNDGHSDTADQALTDMIVATLTSHPQAVFGLISCWDALGMGVYNIATEAGREGDILMVTMGGDKPTMEFLKSKPKGYYGILEFQPYCEGWSWLETGIAILEGEPFRPYQVDRFVTQETVDDPRIPSSFQDRPGSTIDGTEGLPE